MKDALYVKQRYEQTKCEGEVDTSKTNAFTYVKIGNLIENLENTKYIYLDICVDMYICILFRHVSLLLAQFLFHNRK